MAYSITDLNTYSKLFSSSFSGASPITNLLYGGAVASRYTQKLTDSFKTAMSTNLSSLNSNAYQLKSSSQNLIETNKAGVFQAKSASSDNANIAVTAQSGAKNSSYKISVSQTAQAQVTKGTAVASDSATSLEAGTHSIKISSEDKTSTVSFTIKEGQTNKEALSTMADAINKSGSGVTAKVVNDEKTKTSYLEVTGKETGEKNKFSITDLSGSAASNTGIDKTGAAAKDAVYKIDGKEYTSSSNNISLDNGKVNITLKGTTEKETQIKVAENKDAIADGIEKFASSFNNMVEALSGSDQMIGKEKALRDLSNLQSYNRSSLSEIGITANSDGKLTVDREKLEKAIEKDPSKVKRLFNGVDGLASKAQKISDRVLTSGKVAGSYNNDFNSLQSYLNLSGKNRFSQNMFRGLLIDKLL